MSPPADFTRRYSADELKSDFRYLTATVEHIHPDVAAVTDKSQYAALKALTLASLDHPMTRTEFFRAIAPALGRAYADGHTELLTPDEEWSGYKAHGGMAPPFTVRIEDGRILVDRSLGEPALAPGAELVSLNGVPEASLRDWLVNSESMETERGPPRAARKKRPPACAVRVWSLGLRAPYAIVTRAPGAGADAAATSSGIPVEIWTQRQSLSGDAGVSVSIDNGVAHLVVKDFEQPWDKYQSRLKAAFQKIHDAKVHAVVLDLRQNTGGDTRQSDALQAYLSDRVLPAIKEVDVKATPEVKAAYRTLLPEGFRWIPLNQAIPQLAGIQNAPDDGVFVLHPDGARPTPRRFREPLAFTGDLYLLVSPLTYSTALIASAPYKYWKRATVIGEAPTESLTFYGDYYEFDLPHTKLQMHVSHKRFVLFGSDGGDTRLEPDIKISAQRPDAYQIALDVIARRNGLRH